MKQRKAGQRGKRANQHIAAFITHHLAHAHGLQLTLLQQLGVRLAHHQAQAGKQRHHVDGKGHEEGIAPAPVQKLCRAQAAVQVGKQAGSQHKAHWRAQLPDHGKPAAPLLRRAHRQQRGQAVPGAAQRQPLANAQDDQRHDGRAAHRGIAGQKRHARRASAQQEQRQRELGAPAPAPLHGHGNGRAHRAGHKSQREDGKCHQRAVKPRHKREEQRGKHQHAGDTKDKKVEIFRRTPNDDPHRDLTRGDVLVGVGTCEGDRTFKAWNRQCRRTWAVHIDAPQASDTAPFYTPLSRATSELSLGCA